LKHQKELKQCKLLFQQSQENCVRNRLTWRNGSSAEETLVSVFMLPSDGMRRLAQKEGDKRQ
jgi:hypothetical protein